MKLFGFLLGIMVCDLFAMTLIIVVECILDVFRKRKNGSRSVGGGSASRVDCDMPSAGQCNRYHILNSAAETHATTARMAQEAHDIAVRDSQWLHNDACRMAHESHDTAVRDHQAAVECHDQFASAHDFGGCNPFF